MISAPEQPDCYYHSLIISLSLNNKHSNNRGNITEPEKGYMLNQCFLYKVLFFVEIKKSGVQPST